MSILFRLMIIAPLILPHSSWALSKTQIENLEFKKSKKQGEVTIYLKGAFLEEPTLMVRDNIVQLSFSKSFVWPKIEKNISLNTKFDTKLLVYQYDKGTVRFRAILPYSLEGKNSQIKVIPSKDQVKITFPQLNDRVTHLDEGYFKKMLENDRLHLASKTEDKVKMRMNAQKKELHPSSSFSVLNYIFKAGGFLVIVLFLFYGIIHFIKRKIFKKGRLGFLNSTKIIEVVNTTYLAPKRSLILIRVHKKMFLMANTEKGIEFLSQIDDVAEILKEGEQQVNGK